MKALLVHERESFGPEAVSLPGGEAVAITFRCPDKAGPNEDAAVVVPLGDGAVLAVADGVGGSRSAHLASAAVTRALAALDDGGRSDVIDAVELANRQILESSQGAATTVAIA
ncbi:MAG: hypothetical protein KJO55_08865, partial [Gammaproteobacteria bacterium]|nr:hypothetical protein [Gammaproteobacteria bacterium]